MTEQNILFIVEGDNKERKFFKRIAEEFGLNSEIYSYKTNIYALYNEMKFYDFNADIVSILKIHANSEELKILNKKFAFIYLIFDYEIQHNSFHGVFDEKIAKENAEKIFEMSKYFVNETDPTIGKLYINFPMFESYKDIDNLFDENFAYRICPFNEIHNYKEIVGKRKMSNLRVSTMKKDDFKAISLINLKKLNFIFNKNFENPSIKRYQKFQLSDLVIKENECVLSKYKYVNTINTSSFFIVDYFGIKEFYK